MSWGQALDRAFIQYAFKRNKDGVGGTALPDLGTALWLSLHATDPGKTGAGELVTGTSPGYARVSVPTDLDDSSGNAVAWNVSAANGTEWAVTNKTAITLPQAGVGGWNGLQLIRWWGFWTQSTAGLWVLGGGIGPIGPGGLPAGIVVTEGTVPQFLVGQLQFGCD
jgi:hypothetical protein